MFNWGPKAWKPDETVLGNAGEEQGSVCTAQLPAEMLWLKSIIDVFDNREIPLLS